MNYWFEKILKTFASVKLAVVIILSLAVISTVGTIYEATYDAEYAQKLIYHSPYMYAIMLVLCTSLIAVMVDRWPWQKKHTGFIFAHIGIIVTLMGAWLTQKYGVDGTMAFRIGESRQRVTIRDRDLVVYASFDGTEVRPIAQTLTNFITHPPTEQKPFVFPFADDKIEVVDSLHLAFREEEILGSDRVADGPALRLQLKNANVNLTEWLRRESSKPFESLNLGPASVVLSDGSYKPQIGVNEIVFSPGTKKDELRYAVYDKANLLKTRGVVKESESFQVGWMGLEAKVLRYHPRSIQRISYVKAEGSSPMAHSAIKFKFRGQEYWLGIGSLMRLYTEDKMYIVAYVFRQLDIGFPLFLKNFEIGYNEGTQKAASYESVVTTPEGKDVLISMNEPLKYNGFTFYQASFEQDETGRPTTSVLSVNHDPGRWVKYFGSFLIVLGSIMLFYFKKTMAKKSKPQGGSV